MSKNNYEIWKFSVLILGLLIGSFNPSLATDFNPLTPQSDPALIDANNKVNLTQAISQRRDLSAQAKSINVLSDTSNGSIILRGIVQNDREKQTISGIAEQMGLTNIKNELTIKSAVGKISTKNHKPLVINKAKNHRISKTVYRSY